MKPAGYVLLNAQGDFVDYRAGDAEQLHLHELWGFQLSENGYFLFAVSGTVLDQLSAYYADVRAGLHSERPRLLKMPRVSTVSGIDIICTGLEAEHEELRRLRDGVQRLHAAPNLFGACL